MVDEVENPVKDDWIICNSKSHPGLQFYINKATGIKVWNITKEEIALAEKVGKIGPEPVDQPKMSSSRDAKVYNKQIINNQFSNQLSNMLLTSPAVNAFNAWERSHNQPPNLQPQLYTLVPAPLAPMLNQANMQNYQQLLSQSVCMQPENGVPYYTQQYVHQQESPPYDEKRFKNNNYRRRPWRRQVQAPESNFKHMNSQPDLRKKLYRKRSISECNPEDNHNMTIKKENHELNDESTQIDLAPLKTLTGTHSASDQWYIVVEKDVIIENFNYINNMLASDSDCHLVVPRHVMSELQEQEKIDSITRRTLRFLTEQITNGMTMLGDEVNGISSSHNTVLTCVKLASKVNHVVLIACKIETLTFRPNSGIHVFTMQNVKDILANTYTRSISPTMAIKINCTNDLMEPNGRYENIDEIMPQNSYTNLKHHTPAEVISPTDDSLKSSMGTVCPKLRNTPPPIRTVAPKINRTSVTQKTHKEILQSSSRIDEKHPHKIATAESPIVDKSPKSSITIKPITGNNTLKLATRDELLKNDKAPIVGPSPEISMKVVSPIARSNSLKLAKRNDYITYIAPPATVNSNENTNLIIKPIDYINSANEKSIKEKIVPPNCAAESERVFDHSKNENKIHETASSSSTLSNISLDTIGMKKIISMKKLMSTTTARGQTRYMEEITPRELRTNSTSTCASLDNNSTIEPNLKTKKIVTVEETSTSGIISNSESSNSEVVIPVKQHPKKVTMRTVVMYDVACESMAETLKIRSEEWVFRLVQIMEEVLRVKLQENVPFEEKEPAPWNLQEAARCIIKKYSNYFDVVDAANKLSFVLYKTSDKDGKIIEIEPTDYMELYSYGVFLVETFKDMCNDCKETDCRMKKTFEAVNCSCYEVMTALESLKKLLFDIQNANETFVDNPPEFTPDTSIFVNECDHYPYKKEEREECATDIQEDIKRHKKNTPTKKNSLKRRNLRSTKQNVQNAALDDTPKLTRTGKGTKLEFLRSLHLTKQNHTNLRNDVKDICSDKIDAPEQHKASSSSRSNPEGLEDIKCHFSKNEKEVVAKSPSKVVCKFTINEDFERKFKAKLLQKEYEESDKPEENNMGHIETTPNQPSMAENVHDIAATKTDEGPCTVNNFNELTAHTNDQLIKSKCKKADEKFKRFIGRLVRRLRDVFTQARLLCESYLKKDPNQLDTQALHRKIEVACCLIGNIHKSLQRINDRELEDKTNYIQTLLKIANIEDFIPDDKLCSEYRHVIAKCMDIAEEFYSILKRGLPLNHTEECTGLN